MVKYKRCNIFISKYVLVNDLLTNFAQLLDLCEDLAKNTYESFTNFYKNSETKNGIFYINVYIYDGQPPFNAKIVHYIKTGFINNSRFL